MADHGKQRKIFVGVPAYGGCVSTATVVGLLEAQQVFLGNGFEFKIDFEVNLPYIDMARNNLARKFLESGFDELIFIDADVGFTHKAILQLLACDKPLCAGIYPKKSDKEGEWPVSFLKDEAGNTIFPMEEGIGRVARMPTGFMKIKKTVFKEIILGQRTRQYRDGFTGKDTWDFFSRIIDPDGEWYGDDFAFCSRYTSVGGECWVVPDIDFTHVGFKSYKGNFCDFLYRQVQSSITAASEKSAANGLAA